MTKPTTNPIVDAIRNGIIVQPNGIELEATPRKIGGHYLHNIPGLTPQRQSELYQGLLVATGDPHASADLFILAIGGMKLVLRWTQADVRMHREFVITAEQVAGVLDKDEDQLFVEFASNALEEVRQAVADVDETPGVVSDEERSFAGIARAAAGKFMGFLGSIRAGMAQGRAQHEQEASIDATGAGSEHKNAWLGEIARGILMDVFVFNDGRWHDTGKQMSRSVAGLSDGKIAHVIEWRPKDGPVRRIWRLGPARPPAVGDLGFADVLT